MYYLLSMFLKSTSSSPHVNLVTFYQLFSISFKLLFTLYNVNWVGTSAASQAAAQSQCANMKKVPLPQILKKPKTIINIPSHNQQTAGI